MLHGNAETHLVFAYYEKELSTEYRTILMDSRAHGRSRIKPEYAREEFTTADMAGDVKALLDQLQIKSCILLGFSDGANIALEFACLFPERVRAVIAVSGNLSPEGLIAPLRWLSTGRYCFFKAVNGAGKGKVFHHQFFRHQQLASLLCNSPRIKKEQLQKIRAQVLLIAGTRDVVKVSHSRKMEQLIPNAKLILVKGAVHTSMFIRKQFYLAIFRDFLRTIKPAENK